MKSVSGTQLAATGVARVRWPVCKFEMYVSGVWADRTCDVLDWSLSRDRVAPGAMAVERSGGRGAQLSIRLHNWYGNGPIYSEKYTSGPLGSSLTGGLYRVPVRLSAGFLYRIAGTVAGTPTTTAFDTNLTGANGYWNGANLWFTSGGLRSWYKPVQGYVQANGRLTFGSAWWQAPSAGDKFIIELPELLRQFTGVIGEVPGDTVGRRELSLTCYGRGELLDKKQVSTAAWTSQRPDQWIAKLATLTGLVDTVDYISSGANKTLEQGYTTVPVLWEHRSDASTAMIRVAASEGGIVYWDDDGLLHFKNGASGQYDPVTMGQPATVATFNINNCVEIQAQPDTKSRAKYVRVLTTPRARGGLTEVGKLKALAVPPGATLTPTVRLSTPAAALIAPVPRVDYYAHSGVVERTANLSVTIDTARADTPWSQSVRLVITNNHASETLFLTRCVLRGYTYKGQPNEEYELELDVPAGLVDSEGRDIADLDAVQLDCQRRFLAELVGQSLKNRHTPFTVTAPCRPWLEEGDPVLVNDSRTGYTNQWCTVLRTEQRFNNPRGKYEMTLSVTQADLPGASAPGGAPTVTHFIPGHATYGRLNGSYKAWH